MLTISGFLHLGEICLPRKWSSALSVHHCVLAENKKLNINAKKKNLKTLWLPYLYGLVYLLSCCCSSGAGATAGLQGHGGREEQGAGEGYALWLKQRLVKLGIFAERLLRCGRSALQHGWFSPFLSGEAKAV